MTLEQLVREAYAAADANAPWVLAGAALVPLLGTVAARIAKGGKTDADGRLIASLVMAFALVAVVLEIACLFIARAALDANVLEANAMLFAAPVVCLTGAVLGLRLVFPLTELGSVRTAIDLVGFLLACAAVVWLASRFHWGVFFVGSMGQLLVILALAGLVLHRLYRRALRGRDGDR
jgi:hypothetical protein